MAVQHANTDIMDIFEVTGFVDILNIEWFCIFSCHEN
jgi:hypothetical protein